ncbi:TPA: hypothetical protein HA273_05980 [Candidatus Bathyarchaeota archaeon]|nr:hypothetical protein [Candidatus Bathyarchaeota archaeon]HIJ08973.1 hypothetical protein [Candidatus Bathyarchaeota archaeon]
MSQKKNSNVSELIENVLKTDPNINREILGRLIRAENPEYKEPSGRRRLDRALEKRYSSETEKKRKLALAVMNVEKKQKAYYDQLDRENRNKEANMMKSQKLLAQAKELLKE